MNHEELKAFVKSQIIGNEFRGTAYDDEGFPIVRIEHKNRRMYGDSNPVMEDDGFHTGEKKGKEFKEPRIRLSFDVDGKAACHTHYGPGGDGVQFEVAYYTVTGRYSCQASLEPEDDHSVFVVIGESHAVALDNDPKDTEQVIDEDHFSDDAKDRARKTVRNLGAGVALRLNLQGQMSSI